MSLLQQLGVDVHAYAAGLARRYFDKGSMSIDLGENRRLKSQYPPEVDLSIAGMIF